jgi:hypothetical protein
MRRMTDLRWLCSWTFALAMLPASPAEGAPELVFSTFLGGSAEDEGTGIAVDADGHVWVAGFTSSFDFPSVGPPLPGGIETDAFVACFDASGEFLWATTFGGSAEDQARAIAVDAMGNAYVTGITRLREGVPLDFPHMGGMPLPAHPRYEEIFVAKIDPSGALVYSALFGGSSSEIAQAIAVDSAGAAWVAGLTSSPDFPQVRSLAPTLQGFDDAFLVKVNPAGSALEVSTYLGGSSEEWAFGVAVDGSDRAHVVGFTYSEDFPTVLPAPPTGSTSNAFLTTLASSGELLRSTVFGGSHTDIAYAVAADAAGNVFVLGDTSSTDFPLRGPFQPADFGAFLTRFDAAGTMVTSLRLGGLFVLPLAVAVDPAGTIHLGGFGQEGARLVRLDPAMTRIVDTVVLAGTEFGLDPEGAWAVAADAQGNSYLTGVTHSADFPTVRAAQPVYGGDEDAFVAKIAASNAPPDCTGASPQPDRLWPPNGKLQPISISGVTDPGSDQVTLTIASIRQDEPLSKKGQPDATGLGTARPMLRADRTGSGDGRVYHLRFTADDGRGGRCEGEVTVCVPHDQGKKVCGDDGALVDSTGGLR